MKVSKISEMVNKLVNSNTFINICLVGCFSVIGLRSFHQQTLIESLEAENSRLVSTNKSIKNIIWESKQQLYGDSGVVPLSRLKSIYGDIVSPPPLPPLPSDVVASTGGKPAAKIIV